ncbi:hypothetical protein SDRG_15660 [Saprolegnia diclina VS20]|uniref:Uncharacterized protein n=1 Tax=Saprolegnia diclina (strain VS20) TaxID=1156394 RepID=T0RAE5_SAPDV|nr:hypothetical protein SDRG_15660 [Saprolegnia diclina VS20]EQC26482.1 hypothetical protein SDRG_15660 [Saprolegnia diclina VS20]|eukprot:XP_008620061.1 hypothetical protein SDRG_15660 [Saprolegnia diclina VS20]
MSPLLDAVAANDMQALAKHVVGASPRELLDALGAACLAPAYTAFMAIAATGCLAKTPDDIYGYVHLAVEGGSVHIVAALLRLTGIKLALVRVTLDSEVMTPLLVAAITGNAAMVAFLLKHNDMDVDGGRTKDGNSPLGMAAAHGHSSVVSQLLAAGASPRHRNLDGDTVLDLAQLYGQTSIVALLMHHERTQKTSGALGLKSRIQQLRQASSAYQHYSPNDGINFDAIESRISLLKVRASEQCLRASMASTPASSSDDERFRSFF